MGRSSIAARSRTIRTRAALGFRAHSGWAALVAVAGPVAEPAAVVRRHVVLSDRTPRQPFHAAEGRPFAAAEDLVRRSTDEANALADRAVREAVAELQAIGHEVVASGLLLSAGRPLPGLREILASHSLIHSAEGELFRDVLRQASRRCGLGLVEVRERELEERAAQALRRPTADLQRRLAEWGKALGSPWTQDEKRAALVAWMALETAVGGGRTSRSRDDRRGTASSFPGAGSGRPSSPSPSRAAVGRAPSRAHRRRRAASRSGRGPPGPARSSQCARYSTAPRSRSRATVLL